MTDEPVDEMPATWALTDRPWIKGAKALAQFQAQHYATGQSGKNQHHGSKAMTLKDVTAVCQKGTEFGLSHSFSFRTAAKDRALARVTIYHESGESQYSEIEFGTEFKGSRSREQALGSAKTYYHKYMLSGLYGLANDDDDDGEAAVPQVGKAKETPVTTPPAPSSEVGLASSNPTKDNALRILKKPDGKAKAAFMAKFYPSKTQLVASDVNSLEHFEFCDSFEIANAPF